MKVRWHTVIVLVAGLIIGFIAAYGISPQNSQNVLAATAVLSAVFAAVTAYLNYQSRPQLAKAIELHTLDHRELATRFAASIPDPWLADEHQDILQFLNGKWEPTHLGEEDEVLFSDIEKHDDTGILKKWQAWKKAQLDYISKRSLVFKIISEKLSDYITGYELCLTDVPLKEKPKQLMLFAVALIYGKMVSRLFIQKVMDYDTVLSTGGQIQRIENRYRAIFCTAQPDSRQD